MLMAVKPSENFVRSEIAVAYTLLWGACLPNNEEDRQLWRLQAKAAHDAARTSLSYVSTKRPDLLESLKELGEAIVGWSIQKCAWYRAESYRWGQRAPHA